MKLVPGGLDINRLVWYILTEGAAARAGGQAIGGTEMKKIVRANSGKGWVIYDGLSVPRESYPTKAEAQEQLRQDKALAEVYPPKVV